MLKKNHRAMAAPPAENNQQPLLNQEKKTRVGPTWSKLGKNSRRILKSLWPRGRPLIQMQMFVSICLLITSRGVNVLVPIFAKKVVDSLTIQPVTDSGITATGIPTHATSSDGVDQIINDVTAETADHMTTEIVGSSFRWDLILIFIALKTLQGEGGLMTQLRLILWFSVSQHTKEKLLMKLFRHIHSLSDRWHIQKKTGAVIKIMERGVNSVNTVHFQLMTNIFPAVADIIVAVLFFALAFNIWISLTMFITLMLYIILTVAINEWRRKFRRQMNDAENNKSSLSVDSILNFESVKYFAREEFEADQYRKTVREYIKTEWKMHGTVYLMICSQTVILMSGLLVGCMLYAYYVHIEKYTVGDYVLFLAYFQQLHEPLNMFGSFYRILQLAFIDTEDMFDLMDEEPEVKDVPNAMNLILKNPCDVEFRNVRFAYNKGQEVLKGISFNIPAGKTYALVGPSGGGKSTIVKLLLRLYDLQDGQILLEGTDITQVTQCSLRRNISIVPQHSSMFNRDVSYNIRYGQPNAIDDDVTNDRDEDDDVTNAARTANIHSTIMGFPQGYSSKIGERGLKLSGGEQQRMGIARAVIKKAPVWVLDEATSSLDTKCEREIQEALSSVCANRTTLIVAHRLSTIKDAHKILVIKHGTIIEQGTHQDLLLNNGEYATLWNTQSSLSEHGSTDGNQSEAGELEVDNSDKQIENHHDDESGADDQEVAVVAEPVVGSSEKEDAGIGPQDAVLQIEQDNSSSNS